MSVFTRFGPFGSLGEPPTSEDEWYHDPQMEGWRQRGLAWVYAILIAGGLALGFMVVMSWLSSVLGNGY